MRFDLAPLAIATIATITLSSAHATAQPYIEIDVSGLVIGSAIPFFVPFGIRAIFDAGAAPDIAQPGFVQFDAVWGEAIQTTNSSGTPSLIQPFVEFSGSNEYIPANVFLQYHQGINQYWIQCFLNGEHLLFSVDDPHAAFSDAMTSLPDVINDYQPGPMNSQSLSFAADAGDATWNNFTGGSGTIITTLRFVDGPPQPECIADLNNDGALNFLDISAYLIEYGNGCP